MEATELLDDDPACECALAGYCERYRMEQTQYTWEVCQGRQGHEKGVRYRAKWARQRDGTNGAVAVARPSKAPSLVGKAVNATKAAVRAVAGKVRGVPVLCPPEVADAREAICKANTCGHQDSGTCQHPSCGCPTSRKLRLRGIGRPGKVEVSTQKCPVGLWGEWVPAPPVACENPGRIRHLLYHVYPHAEDGGRIWRWNVDLLKRHLSLFNGKRVVGIAVGPETEPASSVREVLAGWGCEFVEVENNGSLREGTTYHALHEAVSQYNGPDHATLFGHTKGVTSHRWASGAQLWAEALYETCLASWPALEEMLRTYPVVGPFKRLGQGFDDVPQSHWHFHGSWHWFRNADFFGRNWRELPQNWQAVEVQPSLIFRSEEAGCIVGEFSNGGLALYKTEAWRDWATPALHRWRRATSVWQPLLLTCVLLSHHKPGTVHDAVRSVLAQSSDDWRLLIIDSGDLAGELRQYESDPRVSVVVSPDPERCQGRQHNEAWRRGLIVGDVVCYLSDDDLYLPNAFAAWLERARNSPDEAAWFGIADCWEVNVDRSETNLGVLAAEAGTSLRGQIDGMQVACRRTVLADVSWPEEEDLESRRWADGVFLDRLQAVTTVHPLAVKVGQHRHTPLSTFSRGTHAQT